MPRDRFYRQPLIGDIPGSFAWILLAVLAVPVAVVYEGLRIGHDGPRVTPAVQSRPAPEQIETRIVAQGYDKNHRSLPFTVYVLTEQVSWKMESATDLAGDKTLLGPELVAAINRSRDVFCIGTASFEGATRAEEARAAERASQMAQWVRAVIRDPEQTQVFRLNAGQYKGPKELQSEYQRKAIVIITGPHDDQVDLREGLTSGLELQQHTSPVVYSLLHHYSRSHKWLKLRSPSKSKR